MGNSCQSAGQPSVEHNRSASDDSCQHHNRRTPDTPRGRGSPAPHFGQRSGWHARQNARPQAGQVPRAAGTTRCSASSHTRRGRSVDALNSHTGGSSRRASEFQSSRMTRSALRRRICTAKRCTGIASSSVRTHSTVTRVAYWRARSSSLARYSRPIASARCSSRRRLGSPSGSARARRIASRCRSLW